MKILVLTSVYPQPDDANYKTTNTVQRFCREWASMGHDVLVVHNNVRFFRALYFLPKFVKRIIERITQIQIPNVESINCLANNDLGVHVFRRSLLKILPHSRFSKKEIEKQGAFILKVLNEMSFEPDVVIGHWANPQAELIHWLKEHFKCSFRTAIVFHNDCEKRDVKRYKLDYFIHSIDRIGCRNKKYGLKIRNNLNLDYDPFLCCSGIDNYAVEATSLDNILLSKTKKTVLYVGRLQKYKHVDSIIEAVHILNDSNIHLKIIGSGTEKQPLLSLTHKYKLEHQCEFVEWLNHDDIFEEMKKSETFVMISENEVFGMVYFEAMLMGCITFATKESAADGIIIDGSNGFLCNAGDSNELASKLKNVFLLDANSKKEIMIKAHETAKTMSDKRVAEEYLNCVIGDCY